VLWWLFNREEDPNATPIPDVTTTATTPGQTTTTAGTPTPTGTATPTATPTQTATEGPTTISVPNVVDKRGNEADQILRDAGFTKVTFVSGDNPNEGVQSLGDWKVTAQQPGAGQSVTADTEIVLTVTKQFGGAG
jgi:hypothetical protein